MTAGVPRILGEAGGVVVAEQGPLILVVDRRTGRWVTLGFVLGVPALVFGLFGLVAIVTGTPSLAIGAVSVLIGIAFTAAVLAVAARIRRARRTPVSAYRPVATFDRARRVFLDADGTAVAALDQVRFQRAASLTSSSTMLVALTPTGRRIIARGNPFTGGLGDLDAILTSAVFGPPQ